MSSQLFRLNIIHRANFDRRTWLVLVLHTGSPRVSYHLRALTIVQGRVHNQHSSMARETAAGQIIAQGLGAGEY